MEIERKFIIKTIPFNLTDYTCNIIAQAYISTNPVIRIRQQNDKYILTIKSKGLLKREEFNLEISKDEFYNLYSKIDGRLIKKKRYLIPLKDNFTAELDVFEDNLEGLKLVEVEFTSEEDALNFTPPDWFNQEVTYNPKYQNNRLIYINSLDELEVK